MGKKSYTAFGLVMGILLSLGAIMAIDMFETNRVKSLLENGQFAQVEHELEIIRESQFCSRLMADSSRIQSDNSSYRRMAALYNQYADEADHYTVESELPMEPVTTQQVVSLVIQAEMDPYRECRDNHGARF